MKKLILLGICILLSVSLVSSTDFYSFWCWELNNSGGFCFEGNMLYPFSGDTFNFNATINSSNDIITTETMKAKSINGTFNNTNQTLFTDSNVEFGNVTTGYINSTNSYSNYFLAYNGIQSYGWLNVSGNANIGGTIDLGTNTITDGSMTGAWNMNSGIQTNVNIDTGNIANAVVNTEWDSAYDHITATGASHSYINQDVTTTGNPRFNGIQIGDAATMQDGGESNDLLITLTNHFTVGDLNYDYMGTILEVDIADGKVKITSGDLDVSGQLTVTSIIQGTRLVSTGDIFTTGSGDDLWLGTSTQANAKFRANATGDVYIAGDANIVNDLDVGNDLNVTGTSYLETTIFGNVTVNKNNITFSPSGCGMWQINSTAMGVGCRGSEETVYHNGN